MYHLRRIKVQVKAQEVIRMIKKKTKRRKMVSLFFNESNASDVSLIILIKAKSVHWQVILMNEQTLFCLQ